MDLASLEALVPSNAAHLAAYARLNLITAEAQIRVKEKLKSHDLEMTARPCY